MDCADASDHVAVFVEHFTIGIDLLTDAINDLALIKFTNLVAFLVEDSASLVHLQAI